MIVRTSRNVGILLSLTVIITANSDEVKNETILKLNKTENWDFVDEDNKVIEINNETIKTVKSEIELDENILNAQKFIGDLMKNNSNTDFNKTVNEADFKNILSTINHIKDHLNVTNTTKDSLVNAEVLDSKYSQILNKISNKTLIDKLKNDIEKTSPNDFDKSDINIDKSNLIDILKALLPKMKIADTNISIDKIHQPGTNNTPTIIITYCNNSINTDQKISENSTRISTNLSDELEYYNSLFSDDDIFEETDGNNLTQDEKNILLEAADYGLEMMNQLYTIKEPELYSMGMFLDDADPARYVAAFNAPSENSGQYSRYGYATIQATTKLQQLHSTDDDLQGRNEENFFSGISTLKDSSLLEQCPLKKPPKCPPASKRYRTHDGICNNLSRLRWGAAMTPVQRFLPPSYSDGIQAPRRSVTGSRLPSPREISSTIHEDNAVDATTITHMLMQWGQFIDHDITASSQTRGFNGSVPRCCKEGGKDFVHKDFLHPECMPIFVPETDKFYGPKGVRCLEFVRSSPASREMCSLGWRDQINQVSGYLDASPLYGSSATQSDRLRLFRAGLLQYGRVNQRKPVLSPAQAEELCKRGAASSDCFRSGDGRVNEHPGLVSMHIVWLRRHNRMAQELAHLNPHWSDEKIYQETRKIVGAMIQHITYKEFLPIVLGPEVIRLFELDLQNKGFINSYNPKINPTPSNSFGTAAFRFGHSLVQPTLMRFDKFHRAVGENVSLHGEPSNPSNVWSAGAMDRLILGLINQPIRKRDEFITDELTNHLFQTKQFNFGMDLAAINIQRGRDHGLPPYTSWREPCGLSEIKRFDDLLKIMPARVTSKFQKLYKHIDDIDLFSGGMAERPVIGGLVGPTFACIIAQQFSNLKKGDRFWYENGGLDSSFTPAQLQQIRKITLSQILCHTLDNIETVQPFVFLAADESNNERISCKNGFFNNFNLSPWIEMDANELENSNDIEKNEKLQMSTKKPDFIRTKKTSVTKGSFIATTKKKNKTPIKVDDKLDFAIIKNRRNDFDSDDYVDEEANINEKLSHESIVIQNKRFDYRPSQPVITVTENTDKVTYLINYVPKSTIKPMRSTKTPENYQDKDIKVTYQKYEDTYRKPTWFNNRLTKRPLIEIKKREETISDELNLETSARSNEQGDSKDSDVAISSSSTDMPEKIITFSHLGTHLGDFNDLGKNVTKSSTTTLAGEPQVPTTTEITKLSTFFFIGLFNDKYNELSNANPSNSSAKNKPAEQIIKIKPTTALNTTSNKVLPDNSTKELSKRDALSEGLRNNSINDTILQKRSPIDEMEIPRKKSPNSSSRIRPEQPLKPAQKTPAVLFEVIPSEISPTQWAVYDEDFNLEESITHKMPILQSDPSALKEIPRPFNFTTLFKIKKRKP